MARLNQNGIKEYRRDAKYNYEGGLSYVPNKEAELYARVLGCMWQEPMFYVANKYGAQFDRTDYVPATLNEREATIWRLACELEPEFVLKLALYAREQMQLRTVPQVLLTIVANRSDLKGRPKPLVAQYGPRIMSRADEIMEVLALQLGVFGKPIPNALRRALAERLNHLTEYEALKYKRKSAEVSLVDALNIIHPNPPNPHVAALFRWLTTGEVDEDLLPMVAAWKELARCEVFDDRARELAKQCNATWEFLVSKFGNRKEVWEAAKLPYMATLRNLRNLLLAGVDVQPHLDLLTNPQAVANSRQYPFRFLSAYAQLEKLLSNNKKYDSFLEEEERELLECPTTKEECSIAPSIVYRALDAIATAAEQSISNMPTLPGRTLVAIDTSTSMTYLYVSKRSFVRCVDVACALGAIADYCCEDSTVIHFDNDVEHVKFPANARLVDRMNILRRMAVGGSTYGYKIFRDITANNDKYDRIIVISDMQMYNEQSGIKHAFVDTDPQFVDKFDEYRRKVNPNVRLVSVCLSGYGDIPVPEEDTLLLSGWNEKMFDLILAWEEDNTTAVRRVWEYSGRCDVSVTSTIK